MFCIIIDFDDTEWKRIECFWKTQLIASQVAYSSCSWQLDIGRQDYQRQWPAAMYSTARLGVWCKVKQLMHLQHARAVLMQHQSMSAERERRKSRSALQSISATPAPRSVPAPRPPAPRSAPASTFSATPAPRSAPLHPIFGPLRSVFRSAHMLCLHALCS